MVERRGEREGRPAKRGPVPLNRFQSSKTSFGPLGNAERREDALEVMDLKQGRARVKTKGRDPFLETWKPQHVRKRRIPVQRTGDDRRT